MQKMNDYFASCFNSTFCFLSILLSNLRSSDSLSFTDKEGGVWNELSGDLYPQAFLSLLGCSSVLFCLMLQRNKPGVMFNFFTAHQTNLQVTKITQSGSSCSRMLISPRREISSFNKCVLMFNGNPDDEMRIFDPQSALRVKLSVSVQPVTML